MTSVHIAHRSPVHLGRGVLVGDDHGEQAGRPLPGAPHERLEAAREAAHA